ncbi:MAG TPA: YdeI/OmpD-associated family protein [Gemmatimonadaceae bacterium]|nr:YdeI/OmpD-associated family protein [Gemmatimonadaceae bacterium]
MGKKDPRIDTYIARQQDFARPILTYLRDVVHEGCPDCEETVKWSSPSFTHHGLLCGFAAFKEHATFGFWKHELVVGSDRGDAMGSFGRLTSVKDLPSKKQLIAMIRKAMELNEQGVTTPRAPKGSRPPIAMPKELSAALSKNKKAKATYDAFSPSHKREYLEWITEARTDDTRQRRVAQAIEWMAEGKARNWKYM